MPRRAGYALASLAGEMTFLFWKNGRRRTIANMKQVLGPGGKDCRARGLAREAMRHYSKTLADFLCLPRFSGPEIDRMVVFDRWDVFDSALARGKGAIFATLHMGSWDMGGAALGRRGYTFSVVADVFKEPALNDMVVRTRRDKGFTIIPSGRITKAAFSALRNNQILGLLIDRPVTDGVTVQFFGAPATLPAGVATLAIRTGAAIVPCCLLRNTDGTFSGIVRDLIFPDQDDRTDDNVQQLTQSVMNSLESIIRLDPGQWFAFRAMWPGQAAGATPPRNQRREALDPC